MIKVRFAPSPTGYLHLGNARTALFNFLFASKKGGEFVLRIDDTDDVRFEEKYKTAIKEDLSWLGIKWHEVFSQSQRFDKYEVAAEQLKARGLLYPCYESEEELALARSALIKASKPPIYNRAHLNLTETERKNFKASGIKPHWRFKLSKKEIYVEDLIHGNIKIKTDSLSDPVLIRADGRFLYTLPSVLDDFDYGITHIIRGDDHLTNSAVQIELAQALGNSSKITFAHHPLMVNQNGTPLSKRNDDFSLRYFRSEGFEPEAICRFLSNHIENTEFDIKKGAAQNIRYERAALEKTNASYIHQMSWQQAIPKLPKEITLKDWQGLRSNLTFLKDAETWHNIIYKNPKLLAQPNEADFLKTALTLLPKPPLDENSWGEWTKLITLKTQRKGKILYLPLRRALTGLDSGPEMKNLILLLGYEKIAERLGQ